MVEANENKGNPAAFRARLAPGTHLDQTQSITRDGSAVGSGNLDINEYILNNVSKLFDGRKKQQNSDRKTILELALRGNSTAEIARIFTDSGKPKSVSAVKVALSKEIPSIEDFLLAPAGFVRLDNILSFSARDGEIDAQKLFGTYYYAPEEEIPQLYTARFTHRVLHGREREILELRRRLLESAQGMKDYQQRVMAEVLGGKTEEEAAATLGMTRGNVKDVISETRPTLEKDVFTPLGLVRMATFFDEIPQQTLSDAVKSGRIGSLEPFSRYRYTSRREIDRFKQARKPHPWKPKSKDNSNGIEIPEEQGA